MSHVPADLTQPAEPPTEPQHDLKPVYDSISTLSRQELPPGAHLPIMQAHPQIRKPPILSDASSMSQHAWRTNQRAWTTRLVHSNHESLHQSKRLIPYLPHFRSTTPASEPHVTDSLSTAPSPHGRSSTSFNSPIPFQSPKEKQYYKVRSQTRQIQALV